jgi:hypothetical protein
MSPLCIGFLHDFCWFFAFVFSSGCVYLCSHLPCTFAGWIPILDFYLAGFSSSLSPSRTTIAHHIPMWNRPGVESTFPPWNDLKKCTMSPMPSSFVGPTGCRPRKQSRQEDWPYWCTLFIMPDNALAARALQPEPRVQPEPPNLHPVYVV